ncbi:hypothetical protein MVEG_03686 [Podila verticillata NRRL 6337]|nr:hypothetical protein MVEG_03686 [Podila verticillata NRRL 6337]
MVLEIQGYLVNKCKKYPPMSDEVYNLQALQQYLRRHVPGLPLRKKGHGQSIMVSDFLSELKGPLKTVDGSGQVLRAREIINPGKKNYDGYWTAEDMAQQFRKAIAIHKRNHPNRIGLWAFDNSSNHNYAAKDALVVSRMNL